MAIRVRAALMVPLAVVTVALYSPRDGTQAEPRRGGFVQRHHRGAGIDHEADALAVDPAVGLEMAAGIARNAEAAEPGLATRLGGDSGSRARRWRAPDAGVILSAICAMKVPRPTMNGRKDHHVTHDATLADRNCAISPRPPPSRD